ncbi:glycosyltransferase family 2 protein [Parageobacillus thermoglucosidasius]|uniref:glycosyltransferase family 2 protein n=1 Tax=Parageobacillus thermoglucosidasius TaxID=1426 RepID=UPI000B560199|nr:glycosyltransferase family 2 protein [Parageobacillus thermoglucosidasius]OUM90033.1 MAG: hypothetical protein BAA00_20655 [Parageobacillus thermoglucosidasius]
MNNAYPSVGIIVINYNGYDDTVECIESLIKLRYPNRKIYIVDNCSPDLSGKRLKKYVSQIENVEIDFIQSNINLGFSGGNNLAIKKAINQDGMDFIWLVNNDAIVDKDSLTYLVDAMKSDKSLGMVSSRIYYYNSNKWWFIGGYIDKWGNIGQITNENEVNVNLNDKYYETDYITGCSLLARTKMIREIGLLNEDFFMYFEDTEWCVRAKKNGWKIGCAPNSIMWHKVSASTNSQLNNPSPLKQYYQLRNHLYMIQYLFPKNKRFIPYLIRVYRMIRRCGGILFRSYETDKVLKLKSVWDAFVDFLNGKKGSLN